ncbi:hypothetical protein GOQ27_07965 [Clostridium sp. D2Q-11]|uniref:Uncharacterized protein n=1 Tax=Anaeromonas frigoriresistens TaxID=2683708 RepID=A0A942V1R0_9FIRM|nr:hypothetical protein [Anaeromonas frigoriresistens]MBS4538397.1 hypothetical protein [Anaeromonas frigoriresistens]
MKKIFVIYGLIGVVLISSLIYLGFQGLSDKTEELYGKALDLSKEVEENLWKDFNFGDYPVAIRQRNTEYVFRKEEMRKRTPVLPVIACTAYPVDGEVNVFMLSKEELDTLGDFAEGIGNEEEFLINQFGLDKKKMIDEQYLSIMYHEGLHAYQLKYYEKNLMNIAKDEYKEIDEKEVLRRVDEEAIVSYYEKEGELLYQAITTQDDKESISLAKEYVSARKKRIQFLEKHWKREELEVLKEQEHYYELVEGTAKYMEEQILKYLEREEIVEKYLKTIKELQEGKQKYYNTGMGICLLLDRFNISWKKDAFRNPIPLNERLEDALEGL